MNSGGVLNQKENATLTENFLNLTNRTDAKEYAFTLINGFSEKEIDEVYKNQKKYKNNALVSYKNFLLETISASKDKSEQETFFKSLKEKLKSKKIGVVCDFNGSARTVSVDKDFFSQFGINFYAINDKPGKIDQANNERRMKLPSKTMFRHIKPSIPQDSAVLAEPAVPQRAIFFLQELMSFAHMLF